MAPLFILSETSAGYALFKSTDKKLLKRTDLAETTKSAEGTCGLLNLKKFVKFDSATSALNEAAAISEGKVSPMLSSLLDSLKDEKKASLIVADPKLATAINKLPQLSLLPISDSSVLDVYRAIREHLPSLITGLSPSDVNTMSLGLSHSLSRHKLKFSPDKVDTMIIQAIALLDDLDKELNMYAMRVKEWYGWHFPEMARIINDNVAYARIVLHVGMRSNTASSDLSEILPEEIEGAVKAAAEVSMGTEITPEDLQNISSLAEQVVEFTEFRAQLSSYLSNRMQAIAPNLTALVGELVGARLIAHSGSLINLAKSPASTIQILGAEKALFRALKTKHDTPKYGLIYHASLIGQASGKNKGKIARILAAKAALGLRVDSLSDWGADREHTAGEEEPTDEERSALGVQARRYVESRLHVLEGRSGKFDHREYAAPQQQQPGKWEVKEARKYNKDADGLAGDEAAAAVVAAELATPKSAKKSKLIQVVSNDASSDEESDDDSDEEMADTPATNGHSKKSGGKDDKAAKKAEKAARKAERAEKRRRKEEKKAKKESKGEGKEKKRKRESLGEEKSEKKKKSKSK